jgi:hypothetical protein
MKKMMKSGVDGMQPAICLKDFERKGKPLPRNLVEDRMCTGH